MMKSFANVVRLHHTSKHFRRIFSRKKSGRSIPDFVSMSYTPSVKLLHKESTLNSLKFSFIGLCSGKFSLCRPSPTCLLLSLLLIHQGYSSTTFLKAPHW